jgi:hypothetical protein
MGSLASRKPPKLLHQAIVKTHQLAIIVVFEDELTRAHFRFLAEKNLSTQVPLQFV